MTNYIDDVFDYDPETGWFTNKYSRGRAKAGERAGSETGHGYRRIIFNYDKYYEHHLAWLYVYGEWPDEIDHINGVRSDNRIANLRPCTRTQNCFNTPRLPGESGLSGAYLDKRNLQWYSKIQIGRRVKFLGNFDSAEEAHNAFINAIETYQGEFAFHNRPEMENV
jgi:hypothetical protein